MISGRGIVLSGRVVSGEISKGDEINIGGETFLITGVEAFSGSFGRTNHNIGLLIRAPFHDKSDFIKHKGEVVVVHDKRSRRDETITNILGND